MAKRKRPLDRGRDQLHRSDTLFGRNWGAIEHHPFLHFEVCYYQAIDFAIKRGLKTVDAGAQGEHKIARATAQTPIPTITSPIPICAAAIADYLKRERAYIAEAGRGLAEAAPFRKRR